MVKRKLGDKEITADRLAAALIDRLIKSENRLDAMQAELNDHLEMIAELQPKLNADRTVTLRAMLISDDGDSAEERIITVKARSVAALSVEEQRVVIPQKEQSDAQTKPGTETQVPPQDDLREVGAGG
jgi:hypothetical protein